jgi:hypothetical protein
MSYSRREVLKLAGAGSAALWLGGSSNTAKPVPGDEWKQFAGTSLNFTTVLCLVFSWNDYAFASTFSGPESQTLPIVVAPMIVVGLVVRRWLVTGLTLGAVTGE